MAGNENVVTDNIFMFLYQQMLKLCHVGYQSIFYKIPGRLAPELRFHHLKLNSSLSPLAIVTLSTINIPGQMLYSPLPNDYSIPFLQR